MNMPDPVDLELAILRRLTATDKLAISQALWQQAWDLKAAGVRRLHPAWSEPRVQAEVRAIFGRDAA